ncbi:unnamed protein product [Pseudo-nitzschia multistriata]|uniref:Uncharacterized protein n=1 Tax=Pseudo-nitzschia multistriata TaxID=183589 RepID=A0A448ZL18_9STRA|nr:unnamed protein product [Pseudo-nitzschia multistriata]
MRTPGMAAQRSIAIAAKNGMRRPKPPSLSRGCGLWTATALLLSGGWPSARRSVVWSAAALAAKDKAPGADRGATTLFSSPLSPSPSSFTIHSSISELLSEHDYDAFILDQFGVLHNGKDPLPGAVDCVERISAVSSGDDDDDDDDTPKTTRKQLLLTVLSNTSSPAKTTLDRLHNRLGFDRSRFIGAVTSGEEAARYIRETFGGPPAAQAERQTERQTKRFFVWCTWDRDNQNVPDPLEFLELCGPGIEPTLDVDRADFVVAHGSGAIRGVRDGGGGDRGLEVRSMGTFLDDGDLGEGTPIHGLLSRCADANLPMVCANPDEVVMYHDGSLKHMPGKLAGAYERILRERSTAEGGEGTGERTPTIRIFGKPHREHFEACLRDLDLAHRRRNQQQQQQQQQPPPAPGGEPEREGPRAALRVAHVGDSLHHDVAGANASGIPSIFVAGGIHAEELWGEGERDLPPSRAVLEEFFAREGHTPTHVVPAFRF